MNFVDGDPDEISQTVAEIVRPRESSGRVPYIPFVRVPHYIFVGRKPVGDQSQ